MDAIITGDIIGFTKLAAHHRETLIGEFSAFLRAELPTYLSPIAPARFEVQRGDSFQGYTAAAEGLRTALLIRCYLNTHLPAGATIAPDELGLRGKRAVSALEAPNARIAIGLGNTDYLAATLTTSDGPAFWHSGRLLEEMKHSRQQLQLVGPEAFPNAEFDVSLGLLEVIMAKWTVPQAQAVFEKLLHKTDERIAHELGITRSAVSSRARYAGWQAISRLLDRYESLIVSLS